jgi:hypothetical protein
MEWHNAKQPLTTPHSQRYDASMKFERTKQVLSVIGIIVLLLGIDLVRGGSIGTAIRKHFFFFF